MKLYFLVPLIAAWLAPQRAPEPLPDVLFDSLPSEYPVFVASGRVLDRDGRVDSLLFPPAEGALIERMLALPETAGCVQLRSRVLTYANPPRRDSLRQAVEAATLALVGRVTGVSPGFHGGSDAGALVQLVPEEFLKADRFGPEAVYYVFINNATLAIGSKRYCQKEATYVSLPELGDRLVVFIPERTASGPFLWLMDGAGALRLSQEKGVELPLRYRAESANKASSAELLAQLRAYAKPGKGGHE